MSNSIEIGQRPSIWPIVVAWLVAFIVPLLFLSIVMPVLPWWGGLLLGLVVGALFVGLKVRNADISTLKKLGARKAEEAHFRRYHNLVDGIYLSSPGVAQPELFVIDDNNCNAVAVAANGRFSLVLTTGIIESLRLVELEAVVAELYVRFRLGDAEAATLGSALVGRPLLDSPFRKLLRPLAAVGLGYLLASDREYVADVEAVRLTRFPPGLYYALSMVSEQGLQPEAATAGTDHLWLFSPAFVKGQPVVPALSLNQRIEVMAEF